MDTRSGVVRKPVVQSAQTTRSQALKRGSSATLTKGGTWPSTKQRLRRGGNLVASAHYHNRANCRLSSKWPRRLVMARERNCRGLRVAILSGFPSIPTPSFSKCPVSGPIPFVGTPDRRPRQIPLAREDIPAFPHRMSTAPPPGPEVISNFNF